ncbi:hypothetical protein [Vogesella sp. XCS3]|uniref:hypothetical protein n=1 Tax=Vogesella sp. XCS3 TaxID=2877939 RepID=UPI001D09F5A1|nr:hypothetical protein [Vogesella sp. XCS3]UDM18958.1 hypothetical protein LCH97_18105 [Vogesella sp. XCS3]
MALVADYQNERGEVGLRLYDDLTGEDLFDLKGDDFLGAIEDGLLEKPSIPRPSDDDWLAPAIAYAKDRGIHHPVMETYSASITYQVWTESGIEAGEPEDTGFEVEDEEVDLDELKSMATKFGTLSPSEQPVTSGHAWLNSMDDDVNFSTGARTSYALHIKDDAGDPLPVEKLRAVMKALGVDQRLLRVPEITPRKSSPSPSM